MDARYLLCQSELFITHKSSEIVFGVKIVLLVPEMTVIKDASGKRSILSKSPSLAFLWGLPRDTKAVGDF